MPSIKSYSPVKKTADGSRSVDVRLNGGVHLVVTLAPIGAEGAAMTAEVTYNDPSHSKKNDHYTLSTEKGFIYVEGGKSAIASGENPQGGALLNVPLEMNAASYAAMLEKALNNAYANDQFSAMEAKRFLHLVQKAHDATIADSENSPSLAVKKREIKKAANDCAAIPRAQR